MEGELFANPHPRRYEAAEEWSIQLKWQVIDGRPEPIAAEIWFGVTPDISDEHGVQWVTYGQQTGPRPITAAALRALPWGRIVAEARNHFVETARVWRKPKSSEPLPAAYVEFMDEVSSVVLQRRPAAGLRPPGRAPLTDEYLEEVARIYRRAQALGGNPTTTVAEELGLVWNTASKHVVRARSRGFLGPTTPGRKGETPPKKVQAR